MKGASPRIQSIYWAHPFIDIFGWKQSTKRLSRMSVSCLLWTIAICIWRKTPHNIAGIWLLGFSCTACTSHQCFCLTLAAPILLNNVGLLLMSDHGKSLKHMRTVWFGKLVQTTWFSCKCEAQRLSTSVCNEAVDTESDQNGRLLPFYVMQKLLIMPV